MKTVQKYGNIKFLLLQCSTIKFVFYYLSIVVVGGGDKNLTSTSELYLVKKKHCTSVVSSKWNGKAFGTTLRNRYIKRCRNECAIFEKKKRRKIIYYSILLLAFFQDNFTVLQTRRVYRSCTSVIWWNAK